MHRELSSARIKESPSLTGGTRTPTLNTPPLRFPPLTSVVVGGELGADGITAADALRHSEPLTARTFAPNALACVGGGH